MLDVLDVQDVRRCLIVGEHHGSDDRPGEVPDRLPPREPFLGLPGGRQRGVQEGMTRACDQPARIQRSRGSLDGGGSAERPRGFGSPGSPLPRGQPGQAAFHLGVQRGPAGEAVLAGHRQLGRRQRYPVRESADPCQGRWLAVSGCTKQLASLAAKLVDVGAARKLGHDVSSRPRLACGLSKKTMLPESTTPEQRWTQVLPANPAAPSNAGSKSLRCPRRPVQLPNLSMLAGRRMP